MNQPSVVVVIPSIGTKKLRNAINSVLNQTYKNVECLVVVDGPGYYEDAKLNGLFLDNVKHMVLPYNTGADGYYGHRIYASIGNLLNCDYVVYLDEDNTFDETHIENHINTIQSKNADWSYSLRKIYENNEYICDDNCESLGKWPIYLSPTNHLIDTSSYCVSRDIAVKIGPAWYNGGDSGKWGSDRNFLANLKHYYPNYACTEKHTLHYSLAGNERSVTKEFFLKGNEVMKEKYPNGFPWHGVVVEDDDGPYLEI
jgi:glycosyltransferase involved in cell wall biosynthesis